MIINSRLDNDFYNFTMGYVVWKWFRDLEVRYAFKNRTLAIPLLEHIDLDELRAEIDHARTLVFHPDEMAFLGGQGLFSEGYLEFLQEMDLPEVEVEARDGWLNIEYQGPWACGVYWETPLLSIVNELYFRDALRGNDTSYQATRTEGQQRLATKLRVLKENPQIRFLEFGSRRRFTQEWQESVLSRLKAEVPDQLIGTSNVHLAHLYEIPVSGTMAHQLFMVLGAQYVAHGLSLDPLGESQNAVMRAWEETYGEIQDGRMLIALPDTFGTPFFLTGFTKEQAKVWRGLRQDSGDPFVVGERVIDAYKMRHVDPTNHSLIFSDGLDINRMLSLSYHFDGRIDYLFGWGTDLTNDLGPGQLALVIKPKEVNGHGCVKLSDDLAKATGSRDDINRYKELASYGQL